jgi:thiol-disulfide isomerase/thioredoxin
VAVFLNKIIEKILLKDFILFIKMSSSKKTRDCDDDKCVYDLGALKASIIKDVKVAKDAKSSYDDKYMVIQFGAAWCKPCRKFTERIDKIREEDRSFGM